MNGVSRTSWLYTAAAVVVLVVLSLWTGATPTSDAYLSFQYARNFDGGHGLVANAGEAPSEGYDNLKWVIVSTVLRRAGMDPPATAPYVSLLFGVACLVTLSSLLRRRTKRPVEWIVPLFVLTTSGPFAVASMSMSGLTAFAFLLLLAAWALDRIEGGAAVLHAVVLVIAVTLAVAARFEGLVAAAVAAVLLVRMCRTGAVTQRFGAMTALAVVLLALAFHAWRVAHFGALLPQSLLLAAGFNRTSLVVTQPFDMAPFGYYYVALALITITAWTRGKHDAGVGGRFALAVAAVLGACYLFVADAVPGLGHHAALIALALVAWPVVVRGVITEAAETAWRKNSWVGRAALVAAVSLILIGVVSELNLTVREMQRSCDESQIAVGRWMRDWRPGLAIATDDPGAFTYAAEAHTLDLRRRSRIGGAGGDRAAVAAREQPDVIVFTANGMFKPEPLLVDTRLFASILPRYRLLCAIRTGWTFDRVFLIYLRRDIPELSDEQTESFPVGIGPALRLNR